MSRVCRITFDQRFLRNTGLTPHLLNLITREFPANTKIVGFGEDAMMWSTFIVLENDSFKDIGAGALLPDVEVKITEDRVNEYSVSMDFSEVMESTQTLTNKTLPTPREGIIYYTGTPPTFMNPTPTIDFTDEEEDTHTCKHEWTTYNSIFGNEGNFEYCKKCDVRKDES